MEQIYPIVFFVIALLTTFVAFYLVNKAAPLLDKPKDPGHKAADNTITLCTIIGWIALVSMIVSGVRFYSACTTFCHALWETLTR